MQRHDRGVRRAHVRPLHDLFEPDLHEGPRRVALRVELGRTADDYDRDRIDAWQSFADGELERTGGRVEARFNGALSATLCPDRIRVNDITFTAKIAANDPDAPTGLLTYGSVSYDSAF